MDYFNCLKVFVQADNNTSIYLSNGEGGPYHIWGFRSGSRLATDPLRKVPLWAVC